MIGLRFGFSRSGDARRRDALRLHDSRDTHVSLLAKAEVPIEVVSKRLDHSTIVTKVDRCLVVYRE